MKIKIGYMVAKKRMGIFGLFDAFKICYSIFLEPNTYKALQDGSGFKVN